MRLTVGCCAPHDIPRAAPPNLYAPRPPALAPSPPRVPSRAPFSTRIRADAEHLARHAGRGWNGVGAPARDLCWCDVPRPHHTKGACCVSLPFPRVSFALAPGLMCTRPGVFACGCHVRPKRHTLSTGTVLTHLCRSPRSPPATEPQRTPRDACARGRQGDHHTRSTSQHVCGRVRVGVGVGVGVGVRCACRVLRGGGLAPSPPSHAHLATVPPL